MSKENILWFLVSISLVLGLGNLYVARSQSRAADAQLEWAEAITNKVNELENKIK